MEMFPGLWLPLSGNSRVNDLDVIFVISLNLLSVF